MDDVYTCNLGNKFDVAEIGWITDSNEDNIMNNK